MKPVPLVRNAYPELAQISFSVLETMGMTMEMGAHVSLTMIAAVDSAASLLLVLQNWSMAKPAWRMMIVLLPIVDSTLHASTC